MLKYLYLFLQANDNKYCFERTNSDRKKLKYEKMNVEFRIKFHYHAPYILSMRR